MGEPHVVDLTGPEPDRPDAGSNDRDLGVWFGAVVLLVAGGAVGWLIGSSGGSDEGTAPADRPTVEPVADGADDPDPVAIPTRRVEAEPDVAEPPPAVASDPPPVEPPPVRSAGFEVTDAVASLEAPVRLVPGLGGRTAVEIAPDGTTSLVLAPSSVSVDRGSGRFDGAVVAELDDGYLFVPADHALGAVARWTPAEGITLPLPDAAYGTSFLAGAGDLGVFISGGDLVVQDLARGRAVVRRPASIGDSAIVHACLDAVGTRVAVVALDGTVLALDLTDGSEIGRLSTSTVRFGVAWLGPTQLAWLAVDGDGQRLSIGDPGSAEETTVARLRDEPWTISTPGTGC